MVFRDNDYNKLEEEVVKYHNEHKDDLGIVVCKNCHALIDTNYHNEKQNKEV